MTKIKNSTMLMAAILAIAMNHVAAAQTMIAASPSPTNVDVPASATQRVTNPDTAPEFQIGVDDVLAINVWKEPDLCRTVPVRPDGRITLPLIGDLHASGKTPRQLQEEIRAGLASFVTVPEVSVIVQEVRSVKFNIVGQVAKPGSYPLTESITVLDAIAQAGGLGIYAKGSGIYVLRMRADGSSVQLPFRYKQVLKGTNLSQNVKLQPRDTVVVP
jgi:polysaccharide export outer membrane protein